MAISHSSLGRILSTRSEILMWYYPAAFMVEKRDVIGAWLVCLLVAAACCGSPKISAALETSAVTRHAAAGCGPVG